MSVREDTILKIMGNAIIRYTKQLLILVPMVGVCFGILGACQRNLEERNSSARSTVVEWRRLAEFPADRANEKIVVAGSTFTREFEIRFELTPTALESWIKDSPGLQDAAVEISGDMTTYLIKPKGAAYGMVRINKRTGEVYIKTYWS